MWKGVVKNRQPHSFRGCWEHCWIYHYITLTRLWYFYHLPLFFLTTFTKAERRLGFSLCNYSLVKRNSNGFTPTWNFISIQKFILYENITENTNSFFQIEQFWWGGGNLSHFPSNIWRKWRTVSQFEYILIPIPFPWLLRVLIIIYIL